MIRRLECLLREAWAIWTLQNQFKFPKRDSPPER